MKGLPLFALVVGLVLAVGTAQALTLQPSGSTYAWIGEDEVSNSGDVYWDPKPKPNTEDDLGKIFRGSAYYPNASKTLAGPGGTADPDVTFYNGQEWAAIIIEVAGLRQYNYFGIYEVSNPATWYQLFSGADGATQKKAFHAPHHFGFYLATGVDSNNDKVLSPSEAKWVWYTQANLNTSKPGTTKPETAYQHFAFLKAKPMVAGLGAYVLGVEDLPFTFDGGSVGGTYYGKSDGDYNDFVVYVANIPDASTFALFLSGLPALALLRRRKG